MANLLIWESSRPKNIGELILTTKSGIHLYLLNEIGNIPRGTAIVDSDYYNTNENSKEVILPLWKRKQLKEFCITNENFFSEKSAQAFYNKMKKQPYVLNVSMIDLPNGFRVHYCQDRKMRDDFMMNKFQRWWKLKQNTQKNY